MTENAPDLKVVAISLDIQFARPADNLANAIAKIGQLSDDTDVIVLPELFSTSFIADKDLLAKYADPVDGKTMTAMREIAAKRACMIAGSFAAADEGHYYNRGFIIMPDGATTYYDKRHLFGVSAEAEVFTGGKAYMPVVNFKGWNISMIICYDLRFPVWSRNVKHRYDMLLVPANWPISRGYAWTHLLIARAIENQAVVVGANRGGSDDYGEYDGLSQIFDGLGMPIGHSDDNLQIVEATVSAADLITARRRLPAHFDADDFIIPIDQKPVQMP